MWVEPHHVGSTFGSLPLTGCLPTNLVTHSSGMLDTCFPLNCVSNTKGPINVLPITLHHTFTENLWKLVTFVSCGLSWDHVCTFRELFTPSRVKDAPSVNKIKILNSLCYRQFSVWWIALPSTYHMDCILSQCACGGRKVVSCTSSLSPPPVSLSVGPFFSVTTPRVSSVGPFSVTTPRVLHGSCPWDVSIWSSHFCP